MTHGPSERMLDSIFPIAHLWALYVENNVA